MEFASVRLTVNWKLPAAVGVPVSTPVGASRIRPGGSDPAETDQVYGCVPPLADRVCE